MRPWSRDLAGCVNEHVVDSVVLRGNPLGDPHERPLWVYVPPEAGDGPLPSGYVIQGFTGQIDMWRNRSALRPTVIERVDALFADEGAPPCLVVFVDCWTSLGGHYDGSYERFWEDFRSRPAFSQQWDSELVNEWAMAACYSADPDGTVRLPFDPATGQLVPEIWERWLAWDPVRMVPRHADALRG